MQWWVYINFCNVSIFFDAKYPRHGRTQTNRSHNPKREYAHQSTKFMQNDGNRYVLVLRQHFWFSQEWQCVRVRKSIMDNLLTIKFHTDLPFRRLGRKQLILVVRRFEHIYRTNSPSSVRRLFTFSLLESWPWAESFDEMGLDSDYGWRWNDLRKKKTSVDHHHLSNHSPNFLLHHSNTTDTMLRYAYHKCTSRANLCYEDKYLISIQYKLIKKAIIYGR